MFKTIGVIFISLFFFTSAHAQPRLPKGYFYQKFSNGLDVVVIENSKVPLVTVEIAVKNGAYTEGPEYSGLSHLFEHMFFKANKDYPDQEHFLKRTQELGIIWNGTTDVERVNYFFTLPKDSIDAGLKFMNAAIRYPIYRKEDMEKERPVVDGEFQRSESNPNNLLWLAVQRKLWGELATRKIAIGDHNVINTATPEKMMIIKDKYYYPNNSILVICGDVQHESAFANARKIFEDWKKSDFNPQVKFPIPEFPALKKSEVFINETTLAQTPVFYLSYHGPGFSFDSAATIYADVFSTLMSLNSSKWHQALVDKGLATYANFFYQTTRLKGSVDMWAGPTPEKLKEFYAEMVHQFRIMGDEDYFTEDQLETARQTIMRNQIRAKEKPSDLSKNLTFNWCSSSLNYLTDYEKNCMKVTRNDIRKFINTYITSKPFIAGLTLNPEMNKTLTPSTYFIPF